MESLDSNESFLFEVMVDPKSKGGGTQSQEGGLLGGQIQQGGGGLTSEVRCPPHPAPQTEPLDICGIRKICLIAEKIF